MNKIVSIGLRQLVKQSGMLVSILSLSLMMVSTVNAHRNTTSEVDTCRFSVGDEVIHFTAYTPTFTGATGYCGAIPHIGLTHLVFDYEGNKLRNTTVEFEITKEPEGTRVFYQEPEKIKKGSVDAKVDFNMHGAGEYLAHVTIMYKGEKLDSHLPFTIGLEPEKGSFPMLVITLLILGIVSVLVMIYLARKKQRVSS